MTDMHDSQKEMVRKFAKNVVNKALKNKLTQATMAEIRIGNDLLVYRKDLFIWVGPHPVRDIPGKNVIVSFNEINKQFRVNRMTKYRQIWL